jgi:hypothetical protein
VERESEACLQEFSSTVGNEPSTAHRLNQLCVLCSALWAPHPRLCILSRYGSPQYHLHNPDATDTKKPQLCYCSGTRPAPLLYYLTGKPPGLGWVVHITLLCSQCPWVTGNTSGLPVPWYKDSVYGMQAVAIYSCTPHQARAPLAQWLDTYLTEVPGEVGVTMDSHEGYRRRQETSWTQGSSWRKEQVLGGRKPTWSKGPETPGCIPTGRVEETPQHVAVCGERPFPKGCPAFSSPRDPRSGK